MKKIISMGIASAVLALTAVAAYAESATAAPAFDFVVDPAAPVAGGTLTVTFTSLTALDAVGFTVETTGLEFVEATSIDTVVYNDNTHKVGGYGISDATDFITLTYTVTAAEGEAVTIELASASPNFDAQMPETKQMAVQVVSGDDTSDIETSASDSETSGSDSETSGSDSETSGSGVQPGKDNPGTGIALAIVPAVLAGAGVVVAKKRK